MMKEVKKYFVGNLWKYKQFYSKRSSHVRVFRHKNSKMVVGKKKIFNSLINQESFKLKTV